MPTLFDEMDSRRDAIIAYIRDHDGCTKAEIIEHMKGRSAVVTTHKIIHELNRDGIILFVPDKKNRQMHHVHLNDKLVSIDMEIERIKQIIDKMEGPIRLYLKHREHSSNEVHSLPKVEGDTPLSRTLDDPNADKKYSIYDDIYHHFISPYEEAVNMMLRILFKRISETVLSDRDADKLRRKIVILLIRLSTQIFSLDKEREYLNFTSWELSTLRLPETDSFVRRNNIDLGIRKELVETIRDFEEKFL